MHFNISLFFVIALSLIHCQQALQFRTKPGRPGYRIKETFYKFKSKSFKLCLGECYRQTRKCVSINFNTKTNECELSDGKEGVSKKLETVTDEWQYVEVENGNFCAKVNGQYSKWSSWTSCTKTCGGGSQLRTRTCTNPPPSMNGKNCDGESKESQECNSVGCPVDGQYSEWSSWSSCTKTCGGCSQLRTRTCTNPPPSDSGKDCFGESEESQTCNTIGCPVNGNYSEWSSWSSCTETCGGGSQLRTRTCTNPPPSDNGEDCVGKSKDSQECNTNGCPVDGQYSEWSNWTCQRECEQFRQHQNRTCTNPSPSNGGKKCQGPSSEEVLDCYTPVNISIEIRSEGADDPDKRSNLGTTSIKIDEIDYSMNSRGMNFVVVNWDTGSFIGRRNFDLYGDGGACRKIYDFVASLKDEVIVLAGAKDESSRLKNEDCWKAFTAIGSQRPYNIHFKASFAIVGYKGNCSIPSWVQHKGNVNRGGATTINLTIKR